MQNFTKASWLANAKRIVIEAEALERKTTKTDELKHEAEELARSRNDSKAATAKRVHGIRAVLVDLQGKIQNGSWQNSSALRNQLETFESKLTSFKMLMRADYDSLEVTAGTLESDISNLVTDMESWDVPTTEAGPTKENAVDPDAQRRINERNKVDMERRGFIGGIDRKIAALGREGGWDPRDHDCFLRIWTQIFETSDLFEHQLTEEHHQLQDQRARDAEEYEHAIAPAEDTVESQYPPVEGELDIPVSRRNMVVKKLAGSIPWKGLEEFEEHIAWYLAYLRLTLIKKRAIGDWKHEQLSAKRQLQENVLASDILRPGEAAASEQVAQDTSMNSGLEDLPPAPQSSEKDRAAAKARIAKWRAQQAAAVEQDKAAKVAEAAAEARRQAEEKRRKQLTVRDQLDKWKRSEELSKELVTEASNKLQRPKSVDPAALRRRQAKDLETARQRAEKVDITNQKKTAREKVIMEAAVPTVEVERDPARLWSATKASERNALTYEALDHAERRRSSAGAHGAAVPMSGRDLQFAGRATPQWMQTARGNY